MTSSRVLRRVRWLSTRSIGAVSRGFQRHAPSGELGSTGQAKRVRRPRFSRVAAAAACLLCVVGAISATAATYTVNSTADTGTGSGTSGDLHYAITQANANPGSTITFSVTGTITLTSALPGISQNLTIQGTGAGSSNLYNGPFTTAMSTTVTQPTDLWWALSVPTSTGAIPITAAIF